MSNPYESPGSCKSMPRPNQSKLSSKVTWCGLFSACLVWILFAAEAGYFYWRDDSVDLFLWRTPVVLMTIQALLLLRVALVLVAMIFSFGEFRTSRIAKAGMALALAGALMLLFREVVR